ncbi:MAG: type I restriction enzyme HsdR N-terminal domain-containing protein, partial [Acidobacteria bacterium]|nr:type I restriction enzyme HsdR N-terminal domain-containing protein [Acidobacteriota bacterium]
MTIKTAISEVKARVAKRTPANEQQTRFLVIDEFLQAAGYDKTDMDLEDRDMARKKPDYTIMPETEFTFFVEAKKWDSELQDYDADQATHYPHTTGKRWVVLTNGKEWRLYDNHISKPPPEKLVAVARLDDPEDPESLERFLTAIGKESVCAGKLGEFAAAELEAKRKREAAQAE